MIGFCNTCDKPLTGKQRQWCSNACRKRLRPNDREPTAISYILVVKYDRNGLADINRSMETWALKK